MLNTLGIIPELLGRARNSGSSYCWGPRINHERELLALSPASHLIRKVDIWQLRSAVEDAGLRLFLPVLASISYYG